MSMADEKDFSHGSGKHGIFMNFCKISLSKFANQSPPSFENQVLMDFVLLRFSTEDAIGTGAEPLAGFSSGYFVSPSGFSHGNFDFI
jgi:hypothetical protein